MFKNQNYDSLFGDGKKKKKGKKKDKSDMLPFLFLALVLAYPVYKLIQLLIYFISNHWLYAIAFVLGAVTLVTVVYYFFIDKIEREIQHRADIQYGSERRGILDSVNEQLAEDREKLKKEKEELKLRNIKIGAEYANFQREKERMEEDLNKEYSRMANETIGEYKRRMEEQANEQIKHKKKEVEEQTLNDIFGVEEPHVPYNEAKILEDVESYEQRRMRDFDQTVRESMNVLEAQVNAMDSKINDIVKERYQNREEYMTFKEQVREMLQGFEDSVTTLRQETSEKFFDIRERLTDERHKTEMGFSGVKIDLNKIRHDFDSGINEMKHKAEMDRKDLERMIEREAASLYEKIREVDHKHEIQFASLREQILHWVTGIEKRITEDVSGLKMQMNTLENSVKMNLNDAITSIGREILRIDQQQMNLLSAMGERFLRLEQTLGDDRLALKQLEQEYRGKMNEVGLELRQVEMVVKNERLDNDRRILQVTHNIQQYANEVEKYKIQMLSMKDRSDMAYEKTEHLLSKSKDLYNAHKDKVEILDRKAQNHIQRLDLKESELGQKLKDTLYVLKDKTWEIENSMKDLAMEKVGVQTILKMWQQQKREKEAEERLQLEKIRHNEEMLKKEEALRDKDQRIRSQERHYRDMISRDNERLHTIRRRNAHLAEKIRSLGVYNY